MARLPNPGSDHEQWGEVLNEFLQVAHNTDGTPKDYVTPEMFGAVGDGVADDTAAWVQMLAGNCPRCICGQARTYLVAAQLAVENKQIDLNRSTLNCHSTSSTRGIWLKSHSALVNGNVNNTVTGSPLSGEFGAGVLIGKYTHTEEIFHVLLRDVTVTTTGAVVVPIVGNVHDVVVENVKFPSNSVSAYAVIVHWGMQTNTPSEGTYHPHNVIIRNCEIGNFSSTGADAGVIATSAAYNVLVENITITGAAKLVVNAFCGDFSFDFALNSTQAAQAHRNIVFRNIAASGVANYGIQITGASTTTSLPYSPASPYVTGPHSMPVMFENVSIAGTNSGSGRAFNIGNVKDPLLINCSARDIYAGFVEAGLSERVTLRNCIVERATNHAFWIQGVAGAEGRNWLLEHCKAIDANTSASGNRGAFAVENQRGIILRDCYIDSPGVTWGIRIGTNVTGTCLYNNFVKRVAGSGVGYSLGLATVYTTIANFEGNTWDESVATGVAGMAPLIVETRSNGTRRLRGAAKPTVNFAARVGDTIENSARIEQGTAGSRYVVLGWECSIAGTPGTYLEMRSYTGA